MSYRISFVPVADSRSSSVSHSSDVSSGVVLRGLLLSTCLYSLLDRCLFQLNCVIRIHATSVAKVITIPGGIMLVIQLLSTIKKPSML